MPQKEFTLKIDSQNLKLETGVLAPQADASVLARLGGNVVLATVVMGPINQEIDYFPLSVEFVDKLYAGGLVKSSRYLKRETGGSDPSVLAGRLIDRAIRPLFPPGFKNEVQVVVTVLSNDKKSDLIIPAFYAVSTALAISPIPFDSPVSACRLAMQGQKLIVNPSVDQLNQSPLDLLVCASSQGVNMIEASASIIDNSTMLQAITLAKKIIDSSNKQITAIARQIGSPKSEFIPQLPDANLVDQVETYIKKDIREFLKSDHHEAQCQAKEQQITDKVLQKYHQQIEDKKISASHLVEAVSAVIKKYLRFYALKGIRFDRRQPDELRPLSSQVGLLPCAHGSALFQRGLTQTLTITTLAGLSECQYFQNSTGLSTKRYIHFYSAPPFSFGQTGRFGRPGRREIGHGALAEKALLPVIPPADDFPYTLILNSEILSQNGSSSMASTCGSTLSLLDAGVPIKDKVAGVSIGMISSSPKKYLLLTDISGLEDHYGDMDFKITGTRQGITAIQLDTKIKGLSLAMIKDVFAASTKARLQILDSMDSTLPQPRSQLSPFAPKIKLIKIPEEKIGDLVGSGGRTIRALMKKYQVEIDVDDEGNISIVSFDADRLKPAVFHIESMLREIKIGEEFDGRVTRVEDYGAFVEFLPGREALVHVSQLSENFVKDIRQLIKVGDKVHVKVIGFNENHQIKLSVPGFKTSHSVSSDHPPRRFKDFHPNLRSSSNPGRRRNRVRRQ